MGRKEAREQALQAQLNEGIDDAVRRWTPTYLAEKLGGHKMTVFESSSTHFRYFDAEKNTTDWIFEAPMVKREMPISEFISEANRREAACSPSHLYLQQSLTGMTVLGDDYGRWDWSWILSLAHIL